MVKITASISKGIKQAINPNHQKAKRECEKGTSLTNWLNGTECSWFKSNLPFRKIPNAFNDGKNAKMTKQQSFIEKELEGKQLVVTLTNANTTYNLPKGIFFHQAHVYSAIQSALKELKKRRNRVRVQEFSGNVSIASNYVIEWSDIEEVFGKVRG